MGEGYYSLDVQKVISSLDSDKNKGLSTAISNQRAIDFGLNEIKRESSVSALTIFFRQFKSFIIYLLIFALVVSALLREYLDAIVIFAILILNATFGFIQEYRAERSIEALKRLSSLKARVIRDGELTEIDATLLVPGDIIIIEEGDKIPADARVIESRALSCLESALSGESNPSSKITEPLKGNL